MGNTSIIRRLRSPTQEFRGLHEEAADVVESLERELAASQAREKVMLGLTNELLFQIDINDFMDSHGHDLKMFKAVHNLMKHNAQPTDDSALKDALAAERERCASICLDIVDGQQYADAIRALENK